MLKAQGADAELCMTSSEAKTRLDEAEFARKRVHLVSALVSPATTHLSASLRRAALSRSSSTAQALIDWELEGEATGLSVLHHIMEVRRRRYPLLGAPPPRRRRRRSHTFPAPLAAQCQKWTAGMWKVVISTQELTEREQQQCREAGVRYFWTKPATVDAREGQQGVRELLAEYRLWAAQQDVSPDL